MTSSVFLFHDATLRQCSSIYGPMGIYFIHCKSATFNPNCYLINYLDLFFIKTNDLLL